MKELFFLNINIIKIYAFSILNFILFTLYISRKKQYSLNGKKIKLIFTFIFLVFFHTILFSFKKSESIVEAYSMLTVFIFIYFILKLNSSLKVLKLYDRFLTLMTFYILGSSTFILLFYNLPVFYSGGNFHGLISNSNTLGLYFIFITPFLINKFFNHPNWKNKLYLKVLLLFDIIWIVFKTNSRGSFTVLIIILLLFLYFKRKNFISKFKFIIFAFLIGSLFASTFSQNVNTFLNKKNTNDASLFMTREALWGARIYAISQKPYLGWGFTVNEFTEFIPGHVNNSKEKGNIILAIVEEFGLIFGSLFLLILFSVFKYSITLYRYQKDKVYIAVTIIAILFHSMVETWVLNFSSFLAIIFWFLILCSFQYQKRKNNLI
jgi:O-antigen ligase